MSRWLALFVVLVAETLCAETIDLESPAGTIGFETGRGAIVSLQAKGSAKALLRSADEIGLWSWRYTSGSCVYARHFSADSSEKRFSWRRLESGLEFAYEAPFARVTVRVKPDERGFLFQSRVEARDSLPAPIEEVWVPSRLAFRPEETEEVVFPMGGNHGLGLALRGSWFGDQAALPPLARTNAWPRTNFFRQWYPATFCDFARIVGKDGSACAVYGVQRRPAHELWKPERHFVSAGWMAHGGLKEGGISHSFRPWIRAGETWSSPVVRLDLSATLESALANYAEANGIGRPLSEKAPPELIEKLKRAPLLKCGWSAADVRAALPLLPVPSVVHCAEYIRGGFDTSYPDHLPPNEAFGTEAELHELQVEARRLGHLVMPYTNPTWWCDNPKGPTFERIGDGPLLKTASGGVHREKYGKKATGFTTTLWHPEVRKANAVTLDQFTRLHPVDILFQDQCGCRECPFDFSPFSPNPWAYSEAMLQMVREGSAKVPLATESGWDRVADYETMLCGLGMWIAPVSNEEKPSQLRKKWRPDTWRIEPLALRLCHDKCFFTFHDLGHFTVHPRTRAWAIALGYGMSASVGRRFADDPEARRRIRQLHAVQTRVVAHLATKKLVSFRHDPSQMLARPAGENSDADDGEVVAQYGDMRVRVNLGDVPRVVDGVQLGPYGYRVDGPGVSVSDRDICDSLALGASAATNRAVIQAAVDRASAAGGGRVTIPAGTWTTGSIQLKSGVELRLEKDATLLGSTDKDDYNANDAFPDNVWNDSEEWSGGHLVWAWCATNVAITGEGTIDGNGPAFFGECDEDSRWPWYKYGLKLHPTDRDWFRPGMMVSFFRCKDVRLSDVKLVRTPAWTCHFRCCDGVDIRSVTIDADRTIANSDGFSIDCTRNVKVSDCVLKTGDDGFAIRASCRHHAATNFCENIEIRNCDIASCCFGIRFGVGSGTIRNVRVLGTRIHEASDAGVGFTPAWISGTRNCYIEDILIRNCTISQCVRPLSGGLEGDSKIVGVRVENSRFETLLPSRFAGSSNLQVSFSDCERRTIERLAVRHRRRWKENEIRNSRLVFAEIGGDRSKITIENCRPQPFGSSGVLLLSFDDRNFADWEAAIPLFAKYGAHATFFICGELTPDAVRAAKKLMAAGHTIGLHGCHHADAVKVLTEKGEKGYWESEFATVRRQADVAYIPVRNFAYPDGSRSEATDKFLLTKFSRLRGPLARDEVRPYDPKGEKRASLRPLATDDGVFLPVEELPKRRVLDRVLIGEAYNTDIGDVVACVRRAGVRKEVLSLASHGIRPDAKHIHMKTEWLERILAAAQDAGMLVAGFDDVPLDGQQG